MSRILLAVSIAFTLACGPAFSQPEETPSSGARERVVLLHGLGRSPRAMAPMAEFLEARGYEVHNVGYPSTERNIDALTSFLRTELARCCPNDAKLHFVTHSLGGVLVRSHLHRERPAHLGRVVMLSPPNHGSELADWIQDSWLADVRSVPAIDELGTDPASLPNRLGPADFDLGIITGDKSWHPVGHWLIEGDSDGVVSVESARLEGTRDFLVVPYTHTFIMRAPDVEEQVAHFLETGHFQTADDTD